MKKSCKNCTALHYHNRDYHCKLQHKLKSYKLLDNTMGAYPLEECPKPLTYDAYFTILQNRNAIRK